MMIRRFITQAVVVAFVALSPAFQGNTVADQPTVSTPGGTPPVGSGRDPLNWVDDIITALGRYFKTNYPNADFGPYLKQLIMVRDALSQQDRRAVKVEMGAFYQSLADRSHGINEAAADELANFARMVMPVQEYGVFFPRSGHGRTDQALGDPLGRSRGAEAESAEHLPRSLYP
jgi:hypothetical protein